MMSAIISWSVQKRWTVLFLTLVLAIWGAWSFQDLPIDAVPDITNVQVQINTLSQGLTPEDLETKVTRPIEIAMGGIPGVQGVRSLTKFGLSQVTVVFEDGSDIYRDRQMVTERLQTLSGFPPGIEAPSLSPISTGLGEIFHYTLRLKNAPNETAALMKIKEIQEWRLKPRLLTVPGVAEVNSIGGLSRQLQVHPNLKKLAEYRVSLSDLKAALAQTNRNAGGGAVHDGSDQLLLQASGQFMEIEQVRKTPVKALANFKNVTIGDVADVEFAPALRTGAALVDGKEAMLGTVMMLSGSNSRTVAKAVGDRIREIQESKELGPDVEIIPLYDRSELVDATLRTVEHNLIVGAVLVILVLFFLLGNFKAALIVSISIPVTLLGTFGFMRIFGISGNLMSLGALDFGIIVDAAVIVVDRCVSWLQDPRKREPTLKRVAGATQEIRSAAGFGQIMVIVVFLPILGLAGIEGKMFRPMAQTFSIALAVALLLSFTMIPALAAALFSAQESEKVPWIMQKLEEFYDVSLRTALRHRPLVLVASLVLLLAGGILFSRLGAEFLPRLDEGSLVLQLTRKPSMSLESSVEQQKKTEAALLKFGAVEKTFSRIGTPEIATDPMGPNEVDNFVLLKTDWTHEGRHFSSKEKLIEAILAHLQKEVPDQEVSATQPIQMRFNDMLEGTKSDLTVKVYGDDLKSLQEDTKKISDVIRGIPGSGDVQTEIKGAIPLLVVRPKLETLGKYSLSAAPILEAIQIGMAGELVGQYYESQIPIPLVIRLKDDLRDSPTALSGLQVGIDSNFTVPLSNVADFKRSEIVSPILRESSKRRSAVLINPRGRDVQSFVTDAQEKIRQSVHLAPGNRIEWFGTFKNLEEARARIMVLGPLALILVIIMLYSAFKSLVETALILASVPFALVGGVIGLWVTGTPFSISTAVGFIALTGIAVLNGVVLVHYFKELLATGDAGSDWLVVGSKSRLRAVLMTALVDIFGFVPMVFSSGVGAEVQKPLAVVIIGGVLTSTALTLIVLPVLSSFVIRARDEKYGSAQIPQHFEENSNMEAEHGFIS